MNKDLINSIGKIIFKVLVWLVFLYVLAMVFTGNWSLRDTKSLVLLSLLITLISDYVFVKRNFIKAFLAIFFVEVSVLIVNLLANPATARLATIKYISFAGCFACAILIVSVIFKNDIADTVLCGMVIALPLLYWNYYFSIKAWFASDALLAILQTNMGEANEYIQDHFSFAGLACTIVLFGVAISIYKTLNKLELKAEKKYYIPLAIFMAILSIYCCYRTRDNVVVNVFTHARQNISKYDDFKNKKEQRKQLINGLKNIKDSNDGVYVLVIGESQNKNHMSAYGYERKTTPWLDSVIGKENFFLFQNAYSCHAHTVPVLTYALTAKNQYNGLNLAEAVSLLEIAETSGFETVWLSNQVKYSAWDTPITVIATEANQQDWINHNVGETTVTNYYDIKLLESLDKIQVASKTLIVIHLMGSHGAYEQRYPQDFSVFSNTGSVNAYDNSIAYTDKVLQLLFDKVNKIPNFKGLVYLSDHAEAVDEKLGHDASKFTWPMARIPLFIYLSKEYADENKDVILNLQAARQKVFTNDFLFNLMLGIMMIQVPSIYEAENDITASTYNSVPDRFKTLYGKKDVVKDNL